MKKALTTITVIAGLLASAATSAASPVAHERASDYVQAGETYWNRMLPGRHPTQPVVLGFVDEGYFTARGWSPQNSAMGDIHGYRIWIKANFWDSYDDSPYSQTLLCTIVVHEYGHLIGLAHNAHYPIMTEYRAPVECGGDDASPNPYLAQTQALYARKARITTTLAEARQPQHRRALRRQLAGVDSAIATLEG